MNDLRFLGIYRDTPSRRSDPMPPVVLRLCTPSSRLRDVPMTERDLLNLVYDAATYLRILERERAAIDKVKGDNR